MLLTVQPPGLSAGHADPGTVGIDVIRSNNVAGGVVSAVFGTYRDLLTAIAGRASALTGLLFVAMSVTSRRSPAHGSAVIRQLRAAAALLPFTNVLAISLFGLVPGNSVGYPTTVMAVIGLFFTAAGVRSILSAPRRGTCDGADSG